MLSGAKHLQYVVENKWRSFAALRMTAQGTAPLACRSPNTQESCRWNVQIEELEPGSYTLDSRLLWVG